jgi:hypothetical protein
MAKFKQVKSFTTAHDNGNHFAAVHDTSAGNPNVYTVFVWKSGKAAKIIGREIPLDLAEKIIQHYPNKYFSGKEVL